jgi:hypothetical protein
MAVKPPDAPQVLEEIKALAAVQFIHLPDLLTFTRRGDLDSAWDERDGELHVVPPAGDHLHYRQRESRLSALVHAYGQREGVDPARYEVADARFPRAVVLRLTPGPEPVTVCPQCGSNDGDGTGKLDGMLAHWQDPTGSGWQCLNPECHWQSEDDLIE